MKIHHWPSDNQTNILLNDLANLIESKVWRADLIMLILLCITVFIDIIVYIYNKYKENKKKKHTYVKPLPKDSSFFWIISNNWILLSLCEFIILCGLEDQYEKKCHQIKRIYIFLIFFSYFSYYTSFYIFFRFYFSCILYTGRGKKNRHFF